MRFNDPKMELLAQLSILLGVCAAFAYLHLRNVYGDQWVQGLSDLIRGMFP